jgi:hypothetical protein
LESNDASEALVFRPVQFCRNPGFSLLSSFLRSVMPADPWDWFFSLFYRDYRGGHSKKSILPRSIFPSRFKLTNMRAWNGACSFGWLIPFRPLEPNTTPTAIAAKENLQPTT